MLWNSLIKSFGHHLQLERSLSVHSIDGYTNDVKKLQQFAEIHQLTVGPADITYDMLQEFLAYLHDFHLSPRSQARIISGIKAFYKFLILEDLVTNDPSELIEGPKLSQKIPDVLDVTEIEKILAAIDLSTDHGLRNRAMLETLYASGLRVSELIGLQLSHYYIDEGYIRVIGKNNKERIVPIGQEAMKHIGFYIGSVRQHLPKIASGHEDYIFLNRRGKMMTRIYVYQVIKEMTALAGIPKKVSPHTFRHSFATHLVEGGADLRAVQEMLGHESITTTEIYTHLDRSYLRDTIMNFHPRNKKT